uniref:Uncharacterized protein n=1 Tax=Nelumbo nucifera TaxID=4432 RepID=A0A822ZKP2_NELNU|nr:TPA_asm: hypothetical protein HUJ06_003962 [Nelumbo nucifera]
MKQLDKAYMEYFREKRISNLSNDRVNIMASRLLSSNKCANSENECLKSISAKATRMITLV